MEPERSEHHTYRGAEFTIVYMEKCKRTYGEFQRIYVLFKTASGKTWSSNLNVSTELIENEPLWKDYVCSQALATYGGYVE